MAVSISPKHSLIGRVFRERVTKAMTSQSALLVVILHE